MAKYISEEMVNALNAELEKRNTVIRYRFHKDPDNFRCCDRAECYLTDEFIDTSRSLNFYISEELQTFAQNFFKGYGVSVKVDDITNTIWYEPETK